MARAQRSRPGTTGGQHETDARRVSPVRWDVQRNDVADGGPPDWVPKWGGHGGDHAGDIERGEQAGLHGDVAGEVNLVWPRHDNGRLSGLPGMCRPRRISGLACELAYASSGLPARTVSGCHCPRSPATPVEAKGLKFHVAWIRLRRLAGTRPGSR